MSERLPITEKSVALYLRKCREKGREAEVERIAVAMCGKPDLWAAMNWPAVDDIACQVPLGNSRADIVLRHADRSVTVIEVKPAGLSLREYCTGIGQLAYQWIMAVSVYQTLDVRRVLCLPGPIPPDLVLATVRSEIEFLPLPTPEQWRGLYDQAMQELAEPTPPLADVYPNQ